MKEPICTVTKAGVDLPLYASRIATVENIRDLPRADILDVYRALAKDQRDLHTIDAALALSVVQGWVERQYFIKVKKTKAPLSVNRALESFITQALDADASEGHVTEKVRRRTQFQVTEACIKAGTTSTDDILDAIHREHPGTKADRFTIANYRSRLRRQGRIPGFIPRGRRSR